MARYKAQFFDGQRFTAAIHLKTYIRTRMEEHGSGTVDIRSSLGEMLMELTRHHHDFEGKSRNGIEWFQLLPTSNGSFHLLIVGSDHTTTTLVSWGKCCENVFRTLPTSERNRRNVRKALREDVRDQISAFKESKRCSDGTFVCSMTGESLRIDEIEIDHMEPTFSELTDRWLESQGGIDRVLYDDANSFGRNRLAEPWRTRWQEYHAQHARLRVLSIEQHRMVTYGSSGSMAA